MGHVIQMFWLLSDLIVDENADNDLKELILATYNQSIFHS